MNQGFLENWLIPGTRQERFKMGLEHVIVQKIRMCEKNDRNMSTEHRNQLEWLPLAKCETVLGI